MEALENQTYLIGCIISNVVAIIMLFAAWKVPWAGRLLFFLLFAWACWTNWTTVSETPLVYLDYAELTFSDWYQQFIRGWFSQHIKLMVGFIATCQGIIANALLLRGWLFKLGILGGITFLLAIIPFGVGSGFPATLTMAIGMAFLLRDYNYYVWQSRSSEGKSKLTTKFQIPINH